MASHSVVIAEPVRTAIGAFGGTLKDVPAPELGAVAIRAAVERAGLRPDEIETVAMGSVIQAGTKMNPARQAAVQAGLPVTGAVLTTKLIHSMRRDGLKRRLVTLCIGGGQGIALAIETLH